jgi:hypothetical protein
MSDSLESPTTKPFRRQHVERSVATPTGAVGTRPVAPPLPAAGRATPDTLLREVESLMAAERAIHLFRQRKQRKLAAADS